MLPPRSETYLTLRAKDKTLDKVKAAALSKALSAPLLAEPDLSNLGISEQWLARNIVNLQPDYRRQSLQMYTDPAAILRLLPRLFGLWYSEDNSQIIVKVRFGGGESWTISSNANAPFMLPWSIHRPGRESTTFDAGLSRAIGSLMPLESTNRDKLVGETLSKVLAREVEDCVNFRQC